MATSRANPLANCLANRLRQMIASHGYTLSGVSKALRYPGLRNKFSSERSSKLTLSDISLVLNFLGCPPQELFAFDDSQGLPESVRLLRQHRLVSEPESENLSAWLRAHPKLESKSCDAPPPEEAEDINQLRLHSLPAARRYAERWVEEAMSRARRGSAKGAQDFVFALCSWSIVARTAGKTNDAAIAIEHALLLQASQPFGYPWISLLSNTALTLRHLAGRAGAAAGLPLLFEALGQIQLLPTSDQNMKRSLLQRVGDLSVYSGALDSATTAFDEMVAIARKPIDRYISTYNCASIACLKEDYATSRKLLLDAESWVSPQELPDSLKFHHLWLSARILANQQQLEPARDIYSSYLVRDTSTHPLNRMLVFCDYALVLVALSEQDALIQTAKELLTHLPNLSVSKAALAIAKSFLELCETTLPTLRLIRTTRRSIENQF